MVTNLSRLLGFLCSSSCLMKLVKKSGLPSCLENMIIAVSRSEFMYCRKNMVNIIKKIAKLKLFIQNVWLDCEDEESKEVLITDQSQIHPFQSSFSFLQC